MFVLYDGQNKKTWKGRPKILRSKRKRRKMTEMLDSYGERAWETL